MDLLNNKENGIKKNKTRKKGIIFLSTIPPFMNVTKITEIMSQFGKLGRVYLQPSIPKPGTKKRKNRKSHFTEGWVEFLSKGVAKEVALQLNNKQISSRKKSRYYDEVWSIKYLPRFKWDHLSERLEYERAVYKQRMRTEISQAKREANYFAQGVELSEKLKKNQKKQAVKSDMLIEYTQRKTNEETSNENNVDSDNRTEFLRGLFGSTVS